MLPIFLISVAWTRDGKGIMLLTHREVWWNELQAPCHQHLGNSHVQEVDTPSHQHLPAKDTWEDVLATVWNSDLWISSSCPRQFYLLSSHNANPRAPWTVHLSHQDVPPIVTFYIHKSAQKEKKTFFHADHLMSNSKTRPETRFLLWHEEGCQTNLSTWMLLPCSPCVPGLIWTHSYLSVFWPSHGSLVNICRSHYHILIVHYHSLCMDINHESLRFKRFGDLIETMWLWTLLGLQCR